MHSIHFEKSLTKRQWDCIYRANSVCPKPTDPTCVACVIGRRKFWTPWRTFWFTFQWTRVIVRVTTESKTFSNYIFVASHFIPKALVVPSAILYRCTSTFGKRNQPVFSFSSSFSLNSFPQMVFFDNIVIYVKSQTTPKKVFILCPVL